MTRTLFIQIAAIVVLLATWILSLLPAPAMPNIQGNDKLHHALAYFACMFFWGQLFREPLQRIKLAISFGAMGALIECIQYFMPTRSFELLDIVADVAGVSVAWLVVTVQLSIVRRWFDTDPVTEPGKLD